MRLIFIVFILLSFYSGQCQFKFYPNNDSTLFDKLYDSTNILEFKFLISRTTLYSSYLELNFNQDSIWSYRRYIIKSINNERLELSPINPSPDIDKVWKQLAELGFLKLKSEEEEKYRLIKDGKLFEISYESYQQMFPSNINTFISEISNQYGTRIIIHHDPSLMLKRFQNSKHSWYVPELYKASFCYNLILDAFSFDDYRNKFIKISNQEPD